MDKRHARTIFNHWLRFLKLHILHADDSPHRIALGAALGLFVAFLPLFGFHMLLVLALCFALRANKLIAVIFVWVSNPFTIIPIYYPSYLLGKRVLNFFHYTTDAQLSSDQMRQIFAQFTSSSAFTHLLSIQFWKDIFEFLWYKGFELWVGATLAGTTVAIIGYFVTSRIIIWYRKNNPRRRFQIDQDN
ncbi:MAG: DUF2062 domain-containing protein [Planctomycetes bacterium]|nr:DUF2062 domain-containing protein [Planctomycetota bacterium]